MQGEDPKKQEEKDEPMQEQINSMQVAEEAKQEEDPDNIFRALYFPIDDGLEESNTVYAQFEANLSRAQFDALGVDMERLDEMARAQRGNNGQYLMLFNDESGSMWGKPFDSVVRSCEIIAGRIFSDDERKPEDNMFELVDLVFYDNQIRRRTTTSKRQFLQFSQEEQREGGTNFMPCYNMIRDRVNNIQNDSDVYILFLTDGQASRKGVDELAAELKALKRTKNIATYIYTLGVSSSHDATLLNNLAQSGSEMGNFIYIDTDKADFEKELVDAVEESVGMAERQRARRAQMFRAMMRVQNTGTQFEKDELCEIIHSYEDAELQNDFYEANEEMKEPQDQLQEMIKAKAGKKEWTSIKYHSAVVMEKSALLDADLVQALTIGDHQQQGKPVLIPATEIPHKLKTSAEMKLINTKIFELVQDIQREAEHTDKKAALERLRRIDESLEDKLMIAMSIKDKVEKKALVGLIQECKTRSSQVIKALKDRELNNLPNELLANLNNLAYEGINKTHGHLSRMVDKMGLQNEALYRQIDTEVKDIVRQTDFEKLRKKHKQVVDDIGECPMSCNDAIEALQDGDCMCIGLQIERPEEAIADPSRLVVKDLFPTYITADSFLQQAEFKIKSMGGKGQALEGGFKGGYGQIASSLGREKINGMMPLFLFQEHWNLAKRKAQPLFGFMCTLNVMGYKAEQFFTVPFLVHIRAMQKCQEAPTEANRNMLQLIEETCIRIIGQFKIFRNGLVEKFTKFATKQGAESVRTQDVVKNISVFVDQIYCLLKVPNLSNLIDDEQFQALLAGRSDKSPQDKLHAMKRTLLRFGMEEVLRRNVNGGEKLVTEDKLAELLFPDHKEFVEKAFAPRQAQLDALNQADENAEMGDVFSQYDQAVQNFKAQGYGTQEEQDKLLEDGDAKMAQGQPAEEQKIDSSGVSTGRKYFEGEIAKAISHQPWIKANKKMVKGTNGTFVRFHSDLILLANKLLDRGDSDKIATLFDFPYLSESGDPEELLLAVLIQNCFHAQNAKRISSIQEGQYIGILSNKKAQEYFAYLLENNLLKQLQGKENVDMKKYRNAQQRILAQQILQAPDHLHAAALMKSKVLGSERDLMQHVLTILKDTKSDDHKQVGLKLALVKQGVLYKRGVQDINAQNSEGLKMPDQPRMANIPAADKIPLGPGGPEKQRAYDKWPIGYKQVFQIWSRQVCDEEDKTEDQLTQTQLENIFPEFKSKLQLYAQCCDKSGKIVRNAEFYKAYQDHPHAHSRRGKSDAEKEEAKGKQILQARGRGDRGRGGLGGRGERGRPVGRGANARGRGALNVRGRGGRGAANARGRGAARGRGGRGGRGAGRGGQNRNQNVPPQPRGLQALGGAQDAYQAGIMQGVAAEPGYNPYEVADAMEESSYERNQMQQVPSGDDPMDAASSQDMISQPVQQPSDASAQQVQQPVAQMSNADLEKANESIAMRPRPPAEEAKKEEVPGQGVPQNAGGAPFAGMPLPPAQMNQAQAFMPGPQAIEVQFANKANMILGALKETNPYYKEMVGAQIFEFVQQLIGGLRADDAVPVCNILIGLPFDQVQAYLRDYKVFKAKVAAALAEVDRK